MATKKPKKKVTHLICDYANGEILTVNATSTPEAVLRNYLETNGWTTKEELNVAQEEIEVYEVSKELSIKLSPATINIVLTEVK